MKEDTGKFGFNARDWKVVPKTKIYDENYDRIFRKIFCQCCGLQVYDIDGNAPDPKAKYICINCHDRFFKEACGEPKEYECDMCEFSGKPECIAYITRVDPIGCYKKMMEEMK